MSTNSCSISAFRLFVLSLFAAFFAVIVPSAQAQGWELLEETSTKDNDVEVRGWAWGRPIKQLGRDMIEFKVKVETKTIGKNKVGRGYVTFAYVGRSGKPIFVKQVTKYAATNLFQSEHEESHEETTAVGANAFWAAFDAEIAQRALTSRATAKVDFPMNTSDAVLWFRTNVSDDLSRSIFQLRDQAVGAVLRGNGWSVRNVARGKF